MKTNEFCKIIELVGFRLVRSNGHLVYSNGQNRIAVPHGKTINRMIARRLLKSINYQSSVPEINYEGKSL